MNKAVFLDRDGVINRKPDDGCYATRWEDIEFLAGAADGIALLRRGGFRIIVVTNQRCVAKGLLTISELEALHERMQRHMASSGAIIDAFYYCPHASEPACDCRKPAPGMVIRASCAHHIELKASWVIGDSDTDIQAGKTAGCKTALIRSHNAKLTDPPDISAGTLIEAAQQIMRREGIPII
jgi:histidinol-phosphate phosphatase family protein